MDIKYQHEKVAVALMIADVSGDFISTLSDIENKFLQGILEGSLDIAIRSIWCERKRKELRYELER